MPGQRAPVVLLLAAVACALVALAVVTSRGDADVERCRVEIVAALGTLPQAEEYVAALATVGAEELGGWTAYAPTTSEADRARELLSRSCAERDDHPEITVIK